MSLLSPLLLLSLSSSSGAAELSAARAKCPSRCDVSKCPSPSCPSGYVPDRCNCCLICAAGEGDSCGRKEDPPCGDSLDCRYPMGKRFAKGVCQCKLSAQVCGSDGRTYDNICQLKAVSRKALQHGLPAVAQVQKGACESGRSMVGTAHGAEGGGWAVEGRTGFQAEKNGFPDFQWPGKAGWLQGVQEATRSRHLALAASDRCGVGKGCSGPFWTAEMLLDSQQGLEALD